MVWTRFAKWMVLIAACVAIKIFSFFPASVERYYSTGIYPWVSRLLRFLLGWIPFSVGDLFYAFFFIWVAVKVFALGKRLLGRRISRPYLKYMARRLLLFSLVLYIVFNLLWGLNYDRQGIAEQLQLEVKPYDTRQLAEVLGAVAAKLNELHGDPTQQRNQLRKKSILFQQSVDAYRALEAADSPFAYRSPSIKASLFSYLGNYIGFTGYYNPFSGEAQVNTTVPVFIRPFTTCHEIGHQLGYAKENEANFSGYLAAKSSPNPSFRYSAYFDLYIYAATELYYRDSTRLLPIRDSLQPAVRRDFSDLRLFLAKYENPVEPFIRRLYGRYLRANKQPQGINTYDEVTAWLVAYYRKFGRQRL